MESNNHLGIYLAETGATVVCVDCQGKEAKAVGAFSVSVEAEQENKFAAIADMVAQGCAQRKLDFTQASIALDCSLFMQHQVHSSFSDYKQISSTVKFDAEETLAMDVAELAAAFKIISADENGSDLHFFTTQKMVLSEVIKAFQGNNIDPVSVEPDVNSLGRFVDRKLGEAEEKTGLYGFFSSKNGYMMIPFDDGGQSLLRTFLIGEADRREELLRSHLRSTLVLAAGSRPVDVLRVFDSVEELECGGICEQLGVGFERVDLSGVCSGEGDLQVDPVEFAIGWGAAMSHLDKVESMSFRSDFMPYQGRKRLIEKTLKLMSVAFTILVIALGSYVQLDYMRKNKPRALLREKFASEYSAVMPGRTMPAKGSTAISNLKKEIRRVENIQSGRISASGEMSISNQLTLVFDAFNKCAKETNLDIESVSISTKTISVVGSTSNRANTQRLRKSIEETNLKILQDRIETKGSRDHFTLTIVPKK